MSKIEIMFTDYTVVANERAYYIANVARVTFELELIVMYDENKNILFAIRSKFISCLYRSMSQVQK